MTNQDLPSVQLTPNRALKSAIDAWQAARPEVEKKGMEQADLEFAVKMRECVSIQHVVVACWFLIFCCPTTNELSAVLSLANLTGGNECVT